MASPTRTSTPTASSFRGSRPASRHGHPDDPSDSADSLPVEVLVQHLLDAKRSLSSMSLVLRANELVTAARLAHEEAVILGAQAEFLRRGIAQQIRLLLRTRTSLTRTYESGKREFKQVIKSLDAANARLEETMGILRSRMVESAFRPPGEDRKSLLDFLNIDQVETVRNSLKENIGALQATQTSFDGDLLRLDNDLRALQKAMAASSFSPSSSASDSYQPVIHLLSSMMEGSHDMAELLASLTKHFDLCVTAVRTTEGGAALARRKAAEATQSQGDSDGVSISGVITEQESHLDDVDPVSPQDRAQMLQVVVQDASEVPDVVQEINERLQNMEEEFARLNEQTDQVKQCYVATSEAFHVLEEVGSRLQSYIAAESEFRERWVEEHQSITERMSEMDGLRAFYETYANAYDSLILEVDRRRAHEDKVLSIWKKAKESVDKIVEADRRQRETFRQDVAEYIPTDLWPGMDDGMRGWNLVPLQDNDKATPCLDRDTVRAAADRLARADRSPRDG